MADVTDEIKVLHVATHDTGGAANSMMRLHVALNEQSVQSRVLCLYKNTDSIEHVYAFKQRESPVQRITGSLKYRWIEHRKQRLRSRHQLGSHLFSFPFSSHDLLRHPLYQWADVIHLHWIGNFLDYKTFFEHNTKPVVQTLHDENLLLGGFHYTFDKDQASRDAQEYDSLLAIKKHQWLLQAKQMDIVCPSKWLYNLARNHRLSLAGLIAIALPTHPQCFQHYKLD